MGSGRLPNKALLFGYDKSLIEHQVERILFSKFADNLVVATTKKKEDKIFNKLLNYKKVSVFRGSTNNVLKRFYDCAKYYKSDIVVRLTGDCPLIDYKLIDKALIYFLKNDYDYVNNINTMFIPDGLHVEIFNFNTLKLAYKKAKSKI